MDLDKNKIWEEKLVWLKKVEGSKKMKKRWVHDEVVFVKYGGHLMRHRDTFISLSNQSPEEGFPNVSERNIATLEDNQDDGGTCTLSKQQSRDY